MSPQASAFQSTVLYQTRMVDSVTGIVSWPWAQSFQRAAQQIAGPANAEVPATAASVTPPFALATDGVYLYVAIGVNSWKRIPLANF